MQEPRHDDREESGNVSGKPSSSGKWLIAIMKIPVYLVVFTYTALLVRDGIYYLGSQTDFPDNKPPAAFVVVLHQVAPESPENGPYRYYFYPTARQILDAREENKDKAPSFLLNNKSGSVTHGDPVTFKVLEEQDDWQIIEVFYNSSRQTWSRYKAYADNIEPISYRDGSMATAFPCVLAGALACLFLSLAIKFVEKKIDQAS